MRNVILQGDALTHLRTLLDESIDCCITSPPYWKQRSYLAEEAPEKAQELGQEITPDQYIAHLTEVFHEVKRVLRDTGSLWLNMGDKFQKKQLLLLPLRVVLALQQDGWFLRSSIIWEKPDALPESVKDRPTMNYEYVFLLVKNLDAYYYDAQAGREPVKDLDRRGDQRIAYHGKGHPSTRKFSGNASYLGQSSDGMRNMRSVWSITTSSSPLAHDAIMSPELVKRCLLAGSRPGTLVLDPFAGSGTVPLVARNHERDYLGIELNPQSVAIARQQLYDGLWKEERCVIEKSDG